MTHRVLRWVTHSISGRRLSIALICGLIGAVVLVTAGAEPMNSVAIGFPGGALTFLLVTH